MPAPGVELRITALDLSRAALESARRGLRGLVGEAGAVRTALAGLASALTVGALVAFGRAGIDAADDLKKVSDRTKITVEDLSGLQFVAEQSDTDFETLTAGLQKFQLALAKAGVSTTDTIGVLGALANRVRDTSDAGQRFEIVAKAFGRTAGPELVNLLAQGSEGINAQIGRLREMGAVMSGETAAAAAEFNDQMAAVGNQISAVAVAIGGGFLAGFREFDATMTSPQLIASMREFGQVLGDMARNAVEFGDKIAYATASVLRFIGLGPPGTWLEGPENFKKVGIGIDKASDSVEFLTGRVAELQSKAAVGRAELAKLGEGDPGGQRLGIERGIENAEIAVGRLQTRMDELGKTATTPEPLQAQVDLLLAGGEKEPKKVRGGGGGAGSAASQAKALIEAALAATQDALDREQRELDQALEDELVSFRDFYARRTAIATAAIDAEIAAKREALAVAKDQGEVARITSEITVLERKRGDVAVAARRDQINAERELADQLSQVRARVLEAEGRTAEATRIRVEAEFRELTARLQIEGDTAGVELVKRLFNIEAARGQLNQLQTEFDRVREQLARDETRVNVEVDTGLTGELAGRREIVRLHTETAAKLAPIVDQMRVIAETIGPEEIARVGGLAAEVENLGTVSNEIAQSLNNEFKAAAASAFGEFVRGSKTAQQAFADFGTAILDSIATIAAQNIAESLFSDLFKTAKKGAGGGGGFLDFLGSLFHQGGIVGSPGPGRRVPVLAFAGAPRFHDGGVLGLRRDEVPAILQRGEEVLTRGDPRHRANRGAGDVTVVMNITTPDVQGFRRSQGQVAVEASTAIGRAARNRP